MFFKLNKQDTKDRILDAAQYLLQTRGYHGFSFHDLPAEVGITTASIHYHFPTKVDLVLAVVQRYTDGFWAFIGSPTTQPPDVALKKFIDAFRITITDGRNCLCGVLGSESDGLPPEVAATVKDFYVMARKWVARVLARVGFSRTEARVRGTTFMSTLEGMMLIARAEGDVKAFNAVANAALVSALPPRRHATRSRSK